MTDVDLSNRKLVVATPTYDGRISIQASSALILAATRLQLHGVQIGTVTRSGCALIAQARNELLTLFMETEGTDLLFLDSDVYFEPEAVPQLMAWATDRDVVAGVCPVRGTKDTEYIAFFDQTGPEGSIVNDGSLLKLERIGMAFTLVRRHVIAALLAAHRDKPYKDKDGKTHYCVFHVDYRPDEGYIGEDFTFCDRVRELGFSIWADPTIRMWHEGQGTHYGCFIDNMTIKQQTAPLPADQDTTFPEPMPSVARQNFMEKFNQCE